jgi:hypothetical protein
MARLGIRVLFEAVLERVLDIRLQHGARPVYRTTQLRSARSLPIRFTPGARRASTGSRP